MPKELSKEPFKRYRFSVPHADVSINQWVENQSNLSMSLRMLIGECIERHGFGDYTCRIRTPGAKRGRPPKSAEVDADEQEFESVVPQQPVPNVTEPVVTTTVAKPVVKTPAPAKSGVLSDDDIAAMFG